jgi:hypothetical protein
MVLKKISITVSGIPPPEFSVSSFQSQNVYPQNGSSTLKLSRNLKTFFAVFFCNFLDFIQQFPLEMEYEIWYCCPSQYGPARLFIICIARCFGSLFCVTGIHVFSLEAAGRQSLLSLSDVISSYFKRSP